MKNPRRLEQQSGFLSWSSQRIQMMSETPDLLTEMVPSRLGPRPAWILAMLSN